MEMKIVQELTRIQERANIFEQKLEDTFVGINLAEAHCIDKIGSMELANVTKIAAEMRMTRGAISKISKKLLDKGLTERYRRLENNKEIYFCLTPQGEKIFNIHKKCHEQALAKKIEILSGYKDEEKAVILRFLCDLNDKHERDIAAEGEAKIG